MTIRHHLSDALLMAYSAGELAEAMNLVVATHLSMCDDCRAQGAAFDALGGALIADLPAETMTDDSLAACLARLDALPREAAPAASRARADVPAPLADYIGGGLDRVKWRPVGMGVRQSILTSAQGTSARLLHIPAGQAIPDHGHRGIELTLVLRGAFRDGADRFGPGDVEFADEKTDHRPVAETGEDCICLAANDGRLRFRGFLPRLAQPFFRI